MASKKIEVKRGATRVQQAPEKKSIRFSRPSWLRASLFAWLMLPVVTGVLFYGGRQMMDSWLISGIDVIGNPVVWTEDDIRNQAAFVVGEGFYSADLDSVFDIVNNMPLIVDVQVRKRWPDRIEITVNEDIPMAVWNESKLIGISGELMDIPAHLNVGNLASITGNFEYLDDSIKQFRLIQQIMGKDGVRIQHLDVSDTGSLTLNLSNRWYVNIGRSRLEQRALRLKKLLAGLAAEQVSAVDLRYGKGAAIKWRSEQEKG
ncbi:MAG: FtsQ-type POTRA domain-containing protein [Thalassolituus sp.]